MKDVKKEKENQDLIRNFLSEVKNIITLLKSTKEAPAAVVEAELETEEEVVETTVETELETEEEVPGAVAGTAAVETTVETELKTEEEVVEETTVETELTTEPVVEEATELSLETFSVQALADMLDLKLNGSYTIEFNLKNGVVVWGDLYAHTYAQLLSQASESDKETIAKLTYKIKEADAKLTALLEDTGSAEFVAPIEVKPLKKSAGEARVDMKKEQMREKRKKA